MLTAICCSSHIISIGKKEPSEKKMCKRLVDPLSIQNEKIFKQRQENIK